MPNVILVPLNGSSTAELALPRAEELVGASGRIVLVRAVLAHAGGPGSLAEARRYAVDQAENYLRAIAARLVGRGRQVETVVAYGSPATVILDQIRISRPDLVAMTTEGRSERGRWCYGSVAEAVLQHSSVPVLLVPMSPARRVTAPLAAMRRLLLPLDGSTTAEASLPIAGHLAGQLGAELVLLRSAEPPTAQPSPTAAPAGQPEEEDFGRLMARAERYLQDVQQRMAVEQPGVATRIDLRSGNPADAIIAAGRDDGVDLIVMTTRTRTGASLVPLGSVATTVLVHGSLPLLLVRPSGPDIELRPVYRRQP